MRFILPLTIAFPILGVLLYSACTYSDPVSPPPDPVSIGFKHYLRSNFGDSIPDEEHYFLMIAHKSSKETILRKTERIIRLLEQKMDREECTLIGPADISLDSVNTHHFNSHVDYNSALDKLEMLYSSVTLIRTRLGRIERKDDVIDQNDLYWENFMK